MVEGWWDMSIRKLVLITGLSIFWSGCASINNQSPLEHWKTFNPASMTLPDHIRPDQTMVVFLRDENAFNVSAVNIFLEGEYLTSLQPGSYKMLPVCANPTQLSAAFTQSELNYSNVRQKTQVYDLPAGKIQYFKLVEDANQSIKIQPLTETQAQQILPTLREQIHTLPRVEKNKVCAKPVYVPVQTVLKKYTLQANTLFAYAKSGPNDMLKKGREEVKTIADQIINEQSQISVISVLGYTDPAGTEAFNQQLSLRRAETVRNLLTTYGVAKQNISVEGRGEQDLVVSDCQSRYAKDQMVREQCDLPNRRVEIITYGIKAE